MPRQVNRTNKWGDTSRTYEIEPGVEYPSVTSILSVISKPALVPWAAKQEREMVLQAAADLYEDVPINTPKMTRPVYLATLTTRIGKVKAYAKELAKASEIGSQCHALIEWNLRRELKQTVPPEPKISDAALWAFMCYEEWRKARRFRPRNVEQMVFSKIYEYAGTMDVDGWVDDLLTVTDWKSGRGIYMEALLQNAAYVHALIEMQHADAPVQGCIVRLPKVVTDPEPEFKLIPWADHGKLFKVFLAVKDLWAWVQEQNAEPAPATAVPLDKKTPPLLDEEIVVLLQCLEATEGGETALWATNKNYNIKGEKVSVSKGFLALKIEEKATYRDELREILDSLAIVKP